MVDNMPLVLSLVTSLRPPNRTEFDEYVQHGSIGLLKAIRKHDPARAKLSTLAWYYIRWEIIRYINRNKRLQKLHDDASYHISSISRRKEQKPVESELFEILPNNLSNSEETVIRMRHQGYTFQEIGTALGDYTRGWASKLFNSAIEKIQDANKETNINAE